MKKKKKKKKSRKASKAIDNCVSVKEHTVHVFDIAATPVLWVESFLFVCLFVLNDNLLVLEVIAIG